MTDIFIIISAVATATIALIAVANFVTQHRTPKPPEEPVTPICTTIIEVDMNTHVRDLPGYTRSYLKRLGCPSAVWHH